MRMKPSSQLSPMSPKVPIPTAAIAVAVAVAVVTAATVPVAAQGLPRLRTDSEPVSTSTVEGGMSIFDLADSLSRALDIDIVFDPRMRDQMVEVSLRDASAKQAFDRVAAVGGLIWVALDERTVLFAEDNPQMRRMYEPFAVQTFYLEHANLRDMMTLVRSTIGARSVVAVDRLHALTVRDTVERVALVERLIERHDRAPAILEIDVRLVQVSAAAMEGVTDATMPISRLDRDAASALVSVGRVVARPVLSLADGAEARVELGTRSEEGPAFDLSLAGRFAASDGTITLEARIEGDSAAVAAALPAERRRLHSTQRLEPGETWAVSGLLRAANAGGATPDHLLVLLTPRIASPGSVQTADREPLAAGTEAHPGLGPSE